MMIRFGMLSIEGFLSIEKVDLNLSTSNSVIIIRGRNGSGKTTLLNSLVWALYGKTFKSIGNDVISRYGGKKGTKVEITWDKDNVIHKVIRCFNYTNKVLGAKGGNRLIYLIDGDPLKNKGKSEIQKAIEENMGVSFKLFKNTIAFGQKLKRFTQESNSDKKQLFEEAFELGYISKAKEFALQVVKNKQIEIDKRSIEINSLRNEYTTLSKAYKDIRERERSFKRDIEKEILGLTNEKDALKKTLKKKKGNEIKNQLTKNIKKLVGFNEEYQILIKNQKKLTNDIEGYTTKKGLYGLIDKVINLISKKDINKALQLLVTIKSLFQSLKENSDSKEVFIEKMSFLKDEIANLKSEKIEISNIEDEISRIDKKISDLKNQKIKVFSKDYKIKKKKVKEGLRKSSKLFDDLVNIQEKYIWLIKDPLGNQGIKTFIFDTMLKGLNEILLKFESIIGFKITFLIEDSSKKRDIITTIEKDGKLFMYEELSGGEQQLVDVVMAISIHHITKVSIDVNVLFLDEVFESLDKDNVEIVMDLISKIVKDTNRTAFVITHQNNIYASNCKVLNVIKENNITAIKE